MAETALAVAAPDKDGTGEQEFKPDRLHCLYRMMQYSSSFSVNVFFGDIDVVGLENIPETGPVILVGNHKNQFVDAMMVVSVVKSRKVSFLAAEKSMHRRIIGDAARMMDAIPVIRPQDRARSSPGVITGYEASQQRLQGSSNCAFLTNVKKGEMIALNGVKGVAPLLVTEVISDTSVLVKPPVKPDDDPDSQAGQLTTLIVPSQGVTFKVIPKIDQSEVFNKVFDALCEGRCIGIFPEGGSSDRTDLLPLKAGVAIMALGALARGAPVKIIPFGINYSQGHRWRSRVLIDVGKPLPINQAILDRYKMGAQKEAHAELLRQIEISLRGVTFNAPDKHTLNILRTMRRLYQGPVKLAPKRFMELNRRFALAFGKFRDDERFLDLVARVHDYMLKLRSLGVQDRQVAELPRLGSPLVSLASLASLLLITIGTSILAISSVPGVLIFLPMLLRVRHVAQEEARKALAGSKVKVKGEDVQASQKIMSTFIWTPVTVSLATGITIGLMVGLWPRQSPYAQGSTEDWFFTNAIWLIPLAVFLFVPLLGFYTIFAVQSVLSRWRWIPYHLLVVKSTCRSNSDASRIRLRRKELALRTQEFFDTIIQPAFPEWAEDVIIHRDTLVEHRRKSDHHHALRVAEEINRMAKDHPLPDSPTLTNSRKTIAGLKSSMARMEEDVSRYEAAGSKPLSPKMSQAKMNAGNDQQLPEGKV